jgi:hypothetical protein
MTPKSGTGRVVRGGSWHSDNTVNFRCAYRNNLKPEKPKALPLRRKLEHWLDGLSQRAALQLYRFDWFAFFHDSVALDRAALLEGLDAYLPQTQGRLRRTAAMGRRRPPADIGSYKAVARAVKAAGENALSDDRLLEIADYLDERNVPPPEAWAELDPPATSWRSAVKSHRRRVGKLIRYRLEQWKQTRRREKQLRRG